MKLEIKENPEERFKIFLDHFNKTSNKDMKKITASIKKAKKLHDKLEKARSDFTHDMEQFYKYYKELDREWIISRPLLTMWALERIEFLLKMCNDERA